MMASPPATPLHLPPSNEVTDDSSARSNSPDGNCPICLEKVTNKAFTDACFHTFCFLCLLEWSQIKATCPMCKASFKSIIHNVVSNDVYDQYHLKPTDSGSFGTDGNGRRFRYSTTMTEERRFEMTVRRNQARERRHQRAQQGHLRAASEERRRMIYQDGLWVRHTGSNRFRDISPEFFQRNPATTHRLVPWLRGELSIMFSGEDHVANMTQYIISLIQNVHMQTEEFHECLRPFLYGQTEHFIHEFVSFARSPYDMNTYDQIAQYDLAAAVRLPQPTVSQPHLSPPRSNPSGYDVITLSSDDDVIEVSTLRSLLRSDNASSSPSQRTNVQLEALDLSSTHNPEPPISYQPDQDQPGSSGMSSRWTVPERGTRKETVISDDSSDIEVVGFVKPFDERTPECVIILSSSTEEDEARMQSERATKEGGKRHEKRKHTLGSEHRRVEPSHSRDRSSEYSSKTHRHSHKRKHKHHRRKSRHTATNHHHHHHHSSQQEEGAAHKHHERPRSRSRSTCKSACSSSSHHASKSRYKESYMRTDEHSKEHARRASVGSIHLQRLHSRSRSKQRVVTVHRGDSLKAEEATDSSQGSEQRETSQHRGSWKLLWHKDRVDVTSGSAEPTESHMSRATSTCSSVAAAAAASVSAATSSHHQEAMLSRKRSASDGKDSRDRFKIRRTDGAQSSGLTMVISRKKSRSRDIHERSSSSTDAEPVKSSHSHRRRHKKHKRHKSSDCRQRAAPSLPYTFHSIMYGREDEENDGDQSSDSTDEEDPDTFM